MSKEGQCLRIPYRIKVLNPSAPSIRILFSISFHTARNSPSYTVCLSLFISTHPSPYFCLSPYFCITIVLLLCAYSRGVKETNGERIRTVIIQISIYENYRHLLQRYCLHCYPADKPSVPQREGEQLRHKTSARPSAGIAAKLYLFIAIHFSPINSTRG